MENKRLIIKNRIVELIGERFNKTLSLEKLKNELPEVAPSTIVYHLTNMVNNGEAVKSTQGRHTWYTLKQKHESKSKPGRQKLRA